MKSKTSDDKLSLSKEDFAKCLSIAKNLDALAEVNESLKDFIHASFYSYIGKLFGWSDEQEEEFIQLLRKVDKPEFYKFRDQLNDELKKIMQEVEDENENKN